MFFCHADNRKHLFFQQILHSCWLRRFFEFRMTKEVFNHYTTKFEKSRRLLYQ